MSPPALPQRVLVVDDELGMREFLELSLRHRGFEVQCAKDGAQALDLLAKEPEPFDLVITDLTMPQVSGIEVLSACKDQDPAPITIMMTAYATTDSAVEAMKLGAEDYLVKPFKLDELYLVIDRALSRRSVEHENKRLKDALDKVHRLDRMVARSDAMIRVFDLVRKAATTPANVLIVGESGTGKELIARALHQLSDRKEEPWVPVNCAAIPANLLESELFGHKKGAFTGATQDRVGLFESAGKGTIFLDEIGELELAMQAKLLRVLQERRVRPVGGTSERELHCRVVTATHQDLQAKVKAGEFREDLYFRLNVIRIAVPALRERKADIPILVETLFEACNARMQTQLEGIGAEAMRWFLSYDYPGNVRELENLIERAVALEESSVLSQEHLPQGPRSTKAGPAANSTGQGMVEQAIDSLRAGQEVDLDALLSRCELSLVKAALLHTEGNRKQAAQSLGISERSFRYRLQKLGDSKQAA